MSDTYTQIHIQCVFAVKYRQATIVESLKDPLEKYITGITQNHGHKIIGINSMPDHLHMFFGMRPTQSISDLMKLVKGESSEWVNKNRLTKQKFQWQSGFGAFSYHRSCLKAIADYVENQQLHHKKVTFLEEYRNLLKEFEIDYSEPYLFKEMI
jgi:putative transposase